MLGSIAVVPDAERFDSFRFDRSVYTGRPMRGIVRAAYQGKPGRTVLRVRDGRDRFYGYGRTLDSLPRTEGIRGVSYVGDFGPVLHLPIPGIGAEAVEVARAENEVLRAANDVALLERARATIHAIEEQRKAARLSRLEDVSGIGKPKWLQKAQTSAHHAVTSATHAVQTVATQAAHATVVNAQSAATSARKAGKSVAHAAQAAANTAKRTVAETRRKLKAELDKLKPTPLRRVILYLTVVPQPAGFAAAVVYMRKHKDEVIRELPAGIRGFLEKAEAQIEGFFSGKHDTIGMPIDELPRLAWMGAMGSIGASEWSKFKAKVAQAWDHQSKGTKAAILTLTLVLLIIGIIIVVFAPAGAPLWGQGSMATYSAAFHAFYVAVGGPGISAMLASLLGFYKAKAGPSGGANVETPVPPEASPATAAAVSTELENAAKDEGAGTGKKIAAAAGAAGLAALFLL